MFRVRLWQGKQQGDATGRGSITLVVLVIIIVFVIMMTASLQFLARQSHAISLQKQQQQAFMLADSGVQYSIWLLSTDGAAPGGLVNSTMERELMDADGMVIGSFVLDFTEAGADWLKLTSTGKVPGNVERCAGIETSLALFSTELGDSYRVVRWHSVGNVTCPEGPPPTDPPPTDPPPPPPPQETP